MDSRMGIVEEEGVGQDRVRGPASGRHRRCTGPGVVLAATVLLALVAASCSTPPAPPAPPATLEATLPAPDSVEALLVLLGDGGEALPGRSPVLARAAEEVEAWAPHLDSGTVRVVLLGDLVYPEGVRPPDEPEYARDTLRLHAQLAAVLGPEARARGAHLDLVPGNHDWGQKGGAEGRARLANLVAVVQGWRARGIPADVRPGAGGFGPAVVDVGASHRLLFLDTQAWLVGADTLRPADEAALAEVMRSAGGRTVSVFAHHPLLSGGEHSTDPPGGSLGGLRRWLSRSGALVQDASSGPYGALIDSMRAVFRRGTPPLVWASGHDHSLQLLAGTEPGDPRWTVVTGSASKLDEVAGAPGMVVGGSWPGFTELFLMRDGSVQIRVMAGQADAQACPASEGPLLDQCMRAGEDGIRPVLSRRLR